MTDTQTTVERSSELQDEYTCDLDLFVSIRTPPVLDNAEYAARTSALMIALNRELARCAAAFGDVWQVGEEDMLALVTKQFAQNYARCRSAVEGAGQTVN